MKPYILGRRGLIHIINIKETLRGLLRAKKFLAQVVTKGDDVLFVGTKRQAREIVKQHATRSEMPYVSERWLGGMLTNFRTIRSRLGRLEELEGLETTGEMGQYSKKMESSLKRERRKIQRNLDGVRNMTRLPGALVVVDVRREHIAVREANKLEIPVVCLLDTDGDPDVVDLPIPCNDDAMRSVDVILSQLADAITEGKAAREEPAPASATTERRPARKRSARAASPSPAESEPGTAPEAKPEITETTTEPTEETPAPASESSEAEAPQSDEAPKTDTEQTTS